MIRNFLAGLVWGAVVAGVGLGVISQVAPMPQRGTTEAQAKADPVETVTAPTSLDPAAEATAGTEPLPEALDPSAKPETVVTEAAPEPEAPDPKATPETVVTETPAPAATPDATAADLTTPPAALADAPAAPAPQDAAQPAPAMGADQTSPAAQTPLAQPEAQGSDPAPAKADLPPPAPPETAEALLNPAPEPEATPDPASIAPQEVAPEADATMPEHDMAEMTPKAAPQDVAPETAAEAPDAAKPEHDMAEMAPEPEPEPAPAAEPAPEVIAPDTSLPKAVDGVTTGRLPAIGKEEPTLEAAPAPQLPIEQYARAFDNPTAKPMFAVVLLDTGAPDLDRARLAALPFPVTFAIDPAAPNAAEAAQIYRAAGQEVVMLATGIPAGATAADLEQTFQSNAATLPESVAVLDLATGGFQDNRPLATMVVPVLAAQGRGLLTFDKGLNAADQVARREGLRAATIFRSLDAEGEDTPLIRRYLDRAAFKAAQEGRVVVLGQTRDETVAALLEWTVEGRAASVALAPLTATLITAN